MIRELSLFDLRQGSWFVKNASTLHLKKKSIRQSSQISYSKGYAFTFQNTYLSAYFPFHHQYPLCSFLQGEKIAMGASGGKDSTVLAHVMNLLNKKYDYGLELILLSIDEGITGYRDDSLETVKDN